jgi:hypothetical protein
MKALGRRLAIILAIMVGLFAILLLGRWWSASQDMLELDRAHLYGRAIDQVGAAHATPTTASQFRLILLPDTPVKDRPAGAPAGAFAGMAPAVLACPLTDAELRRSGPGRCSAAAVALKEPAVCAFIACVVVEAPVAFLEHSGTRQALAVRRLVRLARLGAASASAGDDRGGSRRVARPADRADRRRQDPGRLPAQPDRAGRARTEAANTHPGRGAHPLHLAAQGPGRGRRAQPDDADPRDGPEHRGESRTGDTGDRAPAPAHLRRPTSC